MRKAVIDQHGKAKGVETSDPVARGSWVVVKVRVAPMCTEYKGWQAGQPGAFLGHEAAGEVVDAATSQRLRAGDRVVVMPTYPCGTCPLCLAGDYIHCQDMLDVEACTGAAEGRATMAQYLVKPDWLLPSIPEDLSTAHGAMACCGLGPTFGALERAGVDAFDTVLLTGMGPVGLGGVINARFRGARVLVVESHPWRRAKALELGAHEALASGADALDRVLEWTDGRGVDLAVDCSGAVAAHRLCIDAVRRRGAVAFVGECGDDTPVRVSPDLIRKGIALLGSWHYNLKDVPRIMQVIRAEAERLDGLITHTFGLDDVQAAFELQASLECGKVLLDPWA